MRDVPEGPYPFDWVAPLFRPSIRLMPTAAADEAIPAGASKMGGSPDLNWQDAWPGLSQESPLSFLAQLNCAEMKRSDPDSQLPAEGFLYF